MKKTDCTDIIHHISRIEGQLKRLKADIENNADCKTVTRLSLSASKSFDALRAHIIKQYLAEHSDMNNEEMEAILTLAQA